jgi:glycosyltransferase involved in cell wall biosynthesis
MTEITISVILPCFNERRYIKGCLDSLLDQDIDQDGYEILVIDGMSEDGTRDLLETIQDRRIRVIDNPERTVPYALNRGIREAKGSKIFRADTHAVYPPHYISSLIPFLEREQDINAGGTIITEPGADTPSARAISLAMGNRFGVGPSFRTFSGNTAKEADTVPFGAWKRETMEKVGWFDTELTRGQDLDYNIRLKAQAGRILCIPMLKVIYYTRDTYRKIAAMSYQYGYWKVVINRKHRILSSLRQLFPVTLLLAVAAGAVLTAAVPEFWFIWNAPLFLYVLVNTALSAFAAAREKEPLLFFLVKWAFCVIHFSYGLGYLLALINTYILKKHTWKKVSEVTR